MSGLHPIDVASIGISSGERIADLADEIVRWPTEPETRFGGGLHTICAQAAIEPLDCAIVSSSLDHARAARRAGVSLLALASSPTFVRAFARSGARYVAPDAGALARSFDEALAHACRLDVTLDEAHLERMMEPALAAAETAIVRGEAPVGAAVFSASGELLATGHNRACETGDRTLHAEIDALHTVARRGGSTDAAAILVSTLEPCVMCLSAAMEVGIDVVTFGLESPDDGGLGRVDAPESPENLQPRVRGGVLRHDARSLFLRWMREIATPSQTPFAEALLEQTAHEPIRRRVAPIPSRWSGAQTAPMAATPHARIS